MLRRGQLYRLVLFVGVMALLGLCLPIMSLAQEGDANPGLAPNGLSTPVGNVTAVDTYTAQGTLEAAESQRYRYDSLSRLVEVKTAEATPRQLESFSYTDLGNLLTRGTTTYSYTTSKPHAVTHVSSDPASRFGYDNAGNMTTRGSQNLVYDAEGRLTQVKRDATNVLEEYTYDGNGALMRRKLTPPPPRSNSATR